MLVCADLLQTTEFNLKFTQKNARHGKKYLQSQRQAGIRMPGASWTARLPSRWAPGTWEMLSERRCPWGWHLRCPISLIHMHTKSKCKCGVSERWQHRQGRGEMISLLGTSGWLWPEARKWPGIGVKNRQCKKTAFLRALKHFGQR